MAQNSLRALLLITLSFLLGCAGEKDVQPELRLGHLPRIEPGAGFPLTALDLTGFETHVDKAPLKLLPGNASLLDYLIPLVEPQRLTSLPSTAFTYSSLASEPGAWADIHVLARFEAEEVIARQPDLVLIHDWQAGTTVDRLREENMRVIVMPVADTWKATLDGMRTVARLVGAEERCAAIIAGLEQRRAALNQESQRKGLTVLAYSNYGSGGTTAGRSTTWHAMIELAGMRNAAAELEGHPEIDFEQLLGLDPDFILVAHSRETEVSSSKEALLGDSALANLRAVRDGHFLYLPEYLYSTASHRLLDAAESIAKQAEELLQGK